MNKKTVSDNKIASDNKVVSDNKIASDNSLVKANLDFSFGGRGGDTYNYYGSKEKNGLYESLLSGEDKSSSYNKEAVNLAKQGKTEAAMKMLDAAILVGGKGVKDPDFSVGAIYAMINKATSLRRQENFNPNEVYDIFLEVVTAFNSNTTLKNALKDPGNPNYENVREDLAMVFEELSMLMVMSNIQIETKITEIDGSKSTKTADKELKEVYATSFYTECTKLRTPEPNPFVGVLGQNVMSRFNAGEIGIRQALKFAHWNTSLYSLIGAAIYFNSERDEAIECMACGVLSAEFEPNFTPDDARCQLGLTLIEKFKSETEDIKKVGSALIDRAAAGGSIWAREVKKKKYQRVDFIPSFREE